MNTKTLQKCVDMLRADKPDIPYVLGILDTLIELNPSNETKTYSVHAEAVPVARTESVSNEEEIPAFLKPGPLGRIVG